MPPIRPAVVDDETMSVSTTQSYQDDDLSGAFNSKFTFEENDGQLYVCSKKRKVRPRRARSAVLFDRSIRPSPRKRAKLSQRVSM